MDLCMIVIFAPFLGGIVVFVFQKLIHRRIAHNFEQKLLFVLTHAHTEEATLKKRLYEMSTSKSTPTPPSIAHP